MRFYGIIVVITTVEVLLTMEQRFKTFTTLIASISRDIRRIKAEEMAEFSLKSPHVSCLYYLYSEGNLTAKELCDICEEDKANISRSIKYLEENGFISCDSKTQKRYQAPLELTEKGRAVAKRLQIKIDGILMAASEGVSEEHRAIMYRSLSQINENLSRICDEYDET